jgi:hypothetical protein
MLAPTNTSSDELFIVDHNAERSKRLKYLHDWSAIARAFEIAAGLFEIG